MFWGCKSRCKGKFHVAKEGGDTPKAGPQDIRGEEDCVVLSITSGVLSHVSTGCQLTSFANDGEKDGNDCNNSNARCTATLPR